MDSKKNKNPRKNNGPRKQKGIIHVCPICGYPTDRSNNMRRHRIAYEGKEEEHRRKGQAQPRSSGEHAAGARRPRSSGEHAAGASQPRSSGALAAGARLRWTGFGATASYAWRSTVEPTETTSSSGSSGYGSWGVFRHSPTRANHSPPRRNCVCSGCEGERRSAAELARVYGGGFEPEPVIYHSPSQSEPMDLALGTRSRLSTVNANAEPLDLSLGTRNILDSDDSS